MTSRIREGARVRVRGVAEGSPEYAVGTVQLVRGDLAYVRWDDVGTVQLVRGDLAYVRWDVADEIYPESTDTLEVVS